MPSGPETVKVTTMFSTDPKGEHPGNVAHGPLEPLARRADIDQNVFEDSTLHVNRLSRITITVAVAALTLSLTHVVPASADGPWLDEDFENGASGAFNSSGVHDVSDGHEGNGIRVDIPGGEHWGTTTHWNTKGPVGYEPEEMWIRYWIKFPNGFRIDSPYRGKLPGFGGLYTYNCLGGRPSTSGAPCWSARMAFSPLYASDGLPSRPVDPSKVTRISFYAYLLNSSDVGQDGKILHWDPDLATLDHNRWYCVEARVKMNDLGQRNGILEGYVDGAQAYAASNLNFRRPSESHLKVKSLWFDVYYGGSGTSPKSNQIFFDSVAAGPDRIGCNDTNGSSGSFFDDDDSVFETDIENLAASGITKGCNPPVNDRFCPEESVTRGQMAAFLQRALGDELPVDLVEPPGSPPDFWGARTETYYKTALDVYSDGGVPLDTYVVFYPIDERGTSKDWTRTGVSQNPNHWVPLQLEEIWTSGATPYARVTVDDLRGLADGSLDSRLDQMLETLSGWTQQGEGRRVILDILPEANNSRLPYGDDPGRFKTAFRRVAERARAAMGSSVRTVFTADERMRSSRYSSSEHGNGGFSLYWPGSAADVAGVGGYDDRGGTSVKLFADAIDEMVNAVGPAVPLMISYAGVPPVPSESAQMEFVRALTDLTRQHPQMFGVQWDDRRRDTTGDLRVSNENGLQGGLGSATSGAQSGGIDWLFSNASKTWADARNQAIPFDDTTTSVFVDNIRWLSETGITKGCGPRVFCPFDEVTRGQMAAFLSRALNLKSPAGGIDFDDARGHLFSADIAKLAHAGITKGCNPPANDEFCPDDFVTRGQMAAFLVRAGLTD